MPTLLRSTTPTHWLRHAAVVILAAATLTVAVVHADEPEHKHAEKKPDAPQQKQPPQKPSVADEVTQMLDVLREMEPELAESIDKWRQENPDRVREIINKRFPRLRQMVEMRRHDPELFNLKVDDIRLSRKTVDLVRGYRAASLARDEPRVQDTRNQLRDNLTQQFDVRQKIRQRELQRLEQRIAQLRRELEENSANKDRVLDRELRKVLDDKHAQSAAQKKD